MTPQTSENTPNQGDKKAHDNQAANEPYNESNNEPNQDSQNDRADRSTPIAWIIILIMGLLLINGFLFIQGFFTNLFIR